jgi:hypothetical protein
MGIIKFNMKSPNLIQNIYLYYINIFIEYLIFLTQYIYTHLNISIKFLYMNNIYHFII